MPGERAMLRKKFRKVALRVSLCAIPCLFLSHTAFAQQMPIEICKEAVGSFVSSITDIEGVYQSRGLVTFSGDGTFAINDSGQGGVEGVYEPFSSSQGVWGCKKTGGKTISLTAVGINFTLPKTSGRNGIGRVDYTATYDVDTNSMTGTIDLRFSGADDLESANPNEIDGPAFEQFQFTAQRITLPN